MASRAMINKKTLNVLRENAGVSFEYIERITKFNKDKILQWENIHDESLPTIIQAKKLAKCYRVPFAGLYMNASDINLKHIPKIKNMRTLNGSSFDDSALNLAIIDLINARELLIDAKKDLGESMLKFSFSTKGHDICAWADSIRATFNIELDTQYQFNSKRKFYLYVREQIESAGIFVHCFSGVPIDVARGIAIYNNEMPIIGVNSEDYYPAKTFSIIHELVHIIGRNSTTCNDMYNAFSNFQDEVFCNAVAGEVLVPSDAIKIILNIGEDKDFSSERIEVLSDKFSVSKEVIIRRLLDLGFINSTQYTTFAYEFKQAIDKKKADEKERRKQDGSKGIPRNIARETIDKTSSVLCKTLYNGIGEGIFDKQDISRYLGINQKHVDKFISEVSRWGK